MSESTTPPAKIHSAMLAVMRAVKAVSKDKANQQQGFKYRGIDDVYAALHTVLADAGIYCLTEVLDRNQTERLTAKGNPMFYVVCKYRFHFCADDGSSVHAEMYGEAMDSADKATSKTAAIAHKYALLQAFCIPTDDITDPDKETPEPSFDKAAPAQPATAPRPTPPRAATAPATAAPARTDNPTLDKPEVCEDVRILSVFEKTGSGAKGPWTMWKFTLNNGMAATTFTSETAQAALALLDEGGGIPVDVEVGPGGKPGQINLLSVRKHENDDVPF